jgi:hypothetical protein
MPAPAITPAATECARHRRIYSDGRDSDVRASIIMGITEVASDDVEKG